MSRLAATTAEVRRWFRSKFFKDVSALLSGTVISQLLTVLASPIATRLYAPRDYGVLGLYVAIIALVSVLATGQYWQAIMLPKDDDDARHIIALSSVIATVLALIAGVVVLMAGPVLARWLGEPDISRWLYWLPFSIAFAGIGQALTTWNARQQRFKRLARIQVIQVVIATTCMLSLGFAGTGSFGLVLSYVVGQFVNVALLVGFVLFQHGRTVMAVSWRAVRQQAARYSKFPKYAVATEFINSLTNSLPVLLLNAYFGAAALGSYNLTQRVFGIPSSLIGASLGEVFRQRASRDYAETGNCARTYVKTFTVLFLVSFAVFVVMLLSGPRLFAIVFGEQWRTAGEFARVLSIMYFFRLIASPLSSMYGVVGRQKEDLLLHVYMVLSAAAALYLGYRFSANPVYALAAFSINYAIVYLIYALRAYQFARGDVRAGWLRDPLPSA